MTEILVSLLVVLGAGFVLVASIGLVRLPDLYTRMHASTKPASLGVALVATAIGLHAGELGIAVRAGLVLGFFLLTAPVAAHRLAQAAYRDGVPRWSGTVQDDLADSLRASPREARDRESRPSKI